MGFQLTVITASGDQLEIYTFDETPIEIRIVANESQPMSGLAVDFAIGGLQLALRKSSNNALNHQITYTADPQDTRISIAPAVLPPPEWLTYRIANALLELMFKPIDSESIYFEQE